MWKNKGISNNPIICMQKYAYICQTLIYLFLTSLNLTTFFRASFIYILSSSTFWMQMLWILLFASLKAVDFTAVSEYELLFCNNFLWLQICYILCIIHLLELLICGCGLDASPCSLPQLTTKIQKFISLTNPWMFWCSGL